MSDATVTLPAIGTVKKSYVYVGGAAVVGIVGYAYWRSASAPPADVPAYTEEDIAADGIADTAGGAAGASANSGGASTDASTSPDSDQEWVQQAGELLSGSFDDGALSIALGRYIIGEGLTTAQQDMVRAAIGKVGYPPGGHYPLKPAVTGSPSTFGEPRNVKASSITSNSAVLTWTAVTGAAAYRLWRADIGSEIIGEAPGPTYTMRGLQPNTSYKVQIAARTPDGQQGPRSSPITFKTTAGAAKPTTPSLSGLGRTGAHVSVRAVRGAAGYRWYVNGTHMRTTAGPAWTITGLRPNTAYRVTVSADAGPHSNARAFTTKK